MSRVVDEIEARTCPIDEAAIVETVLGPHRAALASGSVPLVLFCAGFSGRVLQPLLARNGIVAACFCDNDASRVGTEVCGLPVISFDELLAKHRRSLVLIASTSYHTHVERQLLEHGFAAEQIVTLEGRDRSYEGLLRREHTLMVARNGTTDAVRSELRRDADRIEAAYALLADAHSRALFIDRLALVASGYEFTRYRAYLERYAEPVRHFGYDNPARLAVGGGHFYFRNDITALEDGEVLVDGGAYRGDSVADFVAACEAASVRYEHIYSFEPDPGNYAELCALAQPHRAVTCLPFGLWSSSTQLRFVTSRQTDPYSARIMQSETQLTGELVIDTASIDEKLGGTRVTLIKMDVEGAEIEALKGAAATLLRDAPKLVISAYHQTQHLYELPLLVHALQPNYELYLRHFSNHFDDTVLLARRRRAARSSPPVSARHEQAKA